MITFGEEISEALHERVRSALGRIANARISGGHQCVPAFASLAVHYDPAAVARGVAGQAPYDTVVDALRIALGKDHDDTPVAGRLREIPVRYGGELGPDLDDVATLHGLSADGVVHLHASAEYRVYMVGFMPGFAYLGGLPPEIATARRPEPRTHVPAGSVGIGGSQSGVYPMVSPGGWNLIGRTPLRMFDPSRDPASLLHIGDRVRFRAISAEEFAMHVRAARNE